MLRASALEQKTFYLYYMNFMTSGKTANMYLGEKSAVINWRKKKLQMILKA